MTGVDVRPTPVVSVFPVGAPRRETTDGERDASARVQRREACDDPPAKPTEYGHLAPLFAARAALPDGAPQRHRLRRMLIAGHLPVARHLARKYSSRGEQFDDLMQVASLGLVLAVDRFDTTRDVDFLAFAVPTITGEILRHFRDRTTTIRVPRRLRQLQGQIYDAAAELAQRHGRAARPSEIARHLGMDIEVVLEGLAAHGAGHPASLDEPARSGDNRDSVNLMRFASALGETDPQFDLIEHREALAPLLAALTERERQILTMRFFSGMTQSQIGQHIGLSQMHISRLLSRTLDRLRRQLDVD